MKLYIKINQMIGGFIWWLGETFKFNLGPLSPYIFGMMIGNLNFTKCKPKNRRLNK